MSKFFEEIIRARLPNTWGVVRGDFVLSERKEFSESGNEELLSVSEYTGVTPRRENLSEGEHLSRAESLEGYRVVHVNDLVMNYMLAWKGAQGVSPYAGITSPAYSVFEINQENGICGFIHHLFRSDLFKSYLKSESAGIIESRLRFYPESLRTLKLGIPSLEEQTRISNLLDRETTRIDTLIGKKKRFIELLKEKRQALITQAVTKGLDPNVKMKDSGVEWLGEVPEHWALNYLSHVARFSGGGTPSRDNPEYWNGSVPWISPKDMKTEFVVDAEEYITEKGLKESSSSLVPVGCILLVVRSGILKHTIPVAVNMKSVALNQDMKAVHFDSHRLAPLFFMRFVQGKNSDLLDAWLKQGATVESIEQDYLARTLLPVPPMNEQQEIIDFLTRATERVDGLISKTQLSITLLKERRSALITAAVTGQIDLREAA